MNKLFTITLLFLFLFAYFPLPNIKASVTQNLVLTCLTYDGHIYNHGEDWLLQWIWPTGTVVNQTYSWSLGQYYDSYEFWTVRAFTYFDTSMIPDEDDVIISSAVLSLYISSDDSSEDFNVTIQTGGTSIPHVPILDSDYYFSPYFFTNGGNRSTSTITGLGWWNITLNSNGKSWIDKDGTTRFCLRNSNDIHPGIPTTQEEISVRASEYGSVYAPKLYVTYIMEPYTYILHGPFYDDGTTPSGVNVTVTLCCNTPQTFNLPNGSYSNTYTVYSAARPLAFTWNISTATNYTRTIYVTDALFEEIYILIPVNTTSYATYTFSIIDFAGISNAYLETLSSIDGVTWVTERQKADVINTMPFWLTWAHRYDIRLICNRGVYSWGGFIPLGEQLQTLIVTPDMFPQAEYGLIVTLNAERINSSLIQINYTDTDEVTDWVAVSIKYRSGFSYTVAYSTNNTGNTQQIDWNSADNETDYLTDVSIYREGHLYDFTFNCPAPTVSANPWTGLLEVFGTWPFPAASFFAICIILMVAGIFHYAFLAAGCVVTWLIAGFLAVIGWYDIPWVSLGLAGVIAIVVAIQQSKKGVVYEA